MKENLSTLRDKDLPAESELRSALNVSIDPLAKRAVDLLWQFLRLEPRCGKRRHCRKSQREKNRSEVVPRSHITILRKAKIFALNG
jgi:hypothetical protein